MGGCLRRACPCLEALCPRRTGDKPGVDGGGGPEDTPDSAAGGGSIYTALWPFEARHRGELSFREGDLFRVVSRNGDWWTARRIDGSGRVLETGIVPFNYLDRAESVRVQPWFSGTMTRFEARSHLLSPGNDAGAFLIRRSETDGVGFVLSVKLNVQVKHFKILQTDDGGFHIEAGRRFRSLVDLVEHYGTGSLCGIGRLGNPCRRKRPITRDLSHSTVDEWELPKDEFTLEEELGSGFFADVYRGRWRNRINVAIKIIKSDSELNHREFQSEVQILKSLRHRHLISLFAVCTAAAPYYIITELMDKGSLLNFLRGAEGQHLDVVSLLDMGAQVADGMSYLEEKNSIHRDLAARNVLVSEGNICKVADFGLARVIKEPFYVTEEKKIPYKWSAPEAISHGRFSSKSDVWSFGVLLYEIITYGGVPYPAFSNQEVYQQVSDGYRMPLPLRCPAFLYDIMLKCWSADAQQRPDFRWLRLQLDRSSYELQ